MKVENTRIRRSISSGDPEELFLLYSDIKSMASRKFVESRGKTKQKYCISPFLMLVEQGYIPTQDEMRNNNGVYNLLDYQPEDLMHNFQTLKQYFGYSNDNTGRETIPSMHPPHDPVPMTMDLWGKHLQAYNPSFQRNYDSIMAIPATLYPEAMTIITEVMETFVSESLDIPPLMDDLFGAIRFLQNNVLAAIVKGVWDKEHHFRTQHYLLLTKSFGTRAEVMKNIESVHSTLSLACIVKKLDQGSLDAEFVDTT